MDYMAMLLQVAVADPDKWWKDVLTFIIAVAFVGFCFAIFVAIIAWLIDMFFLGVIALTIMLTISAFYTFPKQSTMIAIGALIVVGILVFFYLKRQKKEILSEIEAEKNLAIEKDIIESEIQAVLREIEEGKIYISANDPVDFMKWVNMMAAKRLKERFEQYNDRPIKQVMSVVEEELTEDKQVAEISLIAPQKKLHYRKVNV